MTPRVAAFVLALLVAASLVVTGVALVSTAAAFIVTGLLVGLGAWLVLSD